MKVYITGTTSGIGSEIFNTLKNAKCDVIGLNRPEYNLDKNIDDYVKSDFDVYINNAHHEFSQTKLLYKLFEANENRKCSIINISSMIAERQIDYPRQEQAEKASLDRAARQLQFLERPCRIALLRIGRFDFSKQSEAKQNISNQYLANLIHWLISQPHNISFDISTKFNFN